MSTKKRPDWHLTCKRKDDNQPHRKIGVAWTNEKGFIGIVLDRGERFPDTDTHWVSLAPVKEGAEGRRAAGWQRAAAYRKSQEEQIARLDRKVQAECDRESAAWQRERKGQDTKPADNVTADYMEQQRAERARAKESKSADTQAPPNEAQEGPEWL